MRTGYGRDCHVEAVFGSSVIAGSEGGVWREASGGRISGGPLEIGLSGEVQRGHVGTVLACPEWDCPCRCPRGVPRGLGALGWWRRME